MTLTCYGALEIVGVIIIIIIIIINTWLSQHWLGFFLFLINVLVWSTSCPVNAWMGDQSPSPGG